ncbi:MAG: hypothetical protein HOK61_01545 [Alphaproteobacteria bacterium]|jgi:hypothetical protein|nr:hypothetical protein [Alphaproteobacteria bacterium]
MKNMKMGEKTAGTDPSEPAKRVSGQSVNPPVNATAKARQDARQARVSAALRANLRRRKSQKRGQDEAGDAAGLNNDVEHDELGDSGASETPDRHG